MVNPEMPERVDDLARRERREARRHARRSRARRRTRSRSAATRSRRRPGTTGFYDDWVVPVPDVELERDEGIRAGLDGREARQAEARVREGRHGDGRQRLAAQRRRGRAAARRRGGGRRRSAASRWRGSPAAAPRGVDPDVFGIAPVEAANRALARAGIGWGDVEVVELNEAFASQSLACLTGWPELDPDKLNVNGGAIAIGHPLGASGVRILADARARAAPARRRLRRRRDLHRRGPGPGRGAGGLMAAAARLPDYKSTRLRAPRQRARPAAARARPSSPARAVATGASADARPRPHAPARRRAARASGSSCYGRVLEADGRPVPDTLVEIWQATPPGATATRATSTRRRWTRTSPASGAASPTRTDASASSRSSPAPTRGATTTTPGGRRTSTSRSSGARSPQRLVTQMYFPGDPLFSQDPIFNSVRDACRARAAGLRLRSRPHAARMGARLPLGHRPPAPRPRSSMPDATPPQTVGPFFSIGLPWPDGPDGRRARLRGRDRRCTARSTTATGAPVPDAVIETWQADPDGTRRRLRGFGRCPTDEDGRWEIATVKPGATRRGAGPAHRRLRVRARAAAPRRRRASTSPTRPTANAADPAAVRRSSRGAARDAGRRAAEPGGYRFDIHLQGER